MGAWLDAYFNGYSSVESSTSAPVPQRSTLNFLSPLVATDNPGNGSTDISFGSGTGLAISGDVTGTLGASLVSKISAATGNWSWAATVSSPTITQPNTAGGSAQAITIQAQGSTASTGIGGNLLLGGGTANGATSGTPGSVIAVLRPPSGSGSWPTFQVEYFGGSDTQARFTAGTMSGVTADGLIWLNGGSTAPTSSNFTLYSDGTTATGVNAPSQGYLLVAATTCLTWTTSTLSPYVSTMQWQQNLTPILSQVQQANGSNPANFAINPQAPGAGAASTATGTPGSCVVNVAVPVSTGTEAALVFERNSVPLFRAQALTSSTGYGAIYMGNVTPSGTNYTFADDGVTQLAINAPAGTQINFNMGGTASVALSLNNFQWATGVSVPTINQAASSGAAQTFFVTAQAGGGTNDGGALSLAGGAHAGSSTVDGSVKITTPVNIGELTIQPSAGSNSFTNAQSDNNVFVFGPTQGSAFTINLLRRIADTSLIFVRNNCVGTATIAYLTGGSVTVATNTSALICSDGTNLQKVMVGT